MNTTKRRRAPSVNWEKTLRLRERINDGALTKAEQEAVAHVKITAALRPLTPQKRARVLRAAAALHGIVL